MTSATSKELVQIRERLNELRERDTAFEVFGSSRHRYVLNPPLKAAELREFETTHSVILPDAYRSFLLECGNGGAGPYYGIFPLGHRDHGAGGPLEAWAEGDGLAGVLSRPFPHDRAWNLPEERFSPPAVFRCAEEEKIWYRTLEDDTWKSSLVDGALPICHQGCAIRNYLVVTGTERGNVWIDDRVNHNGIYPEATDSSGRVPFLEWYSSWIATSLARVR
ncbi:MAG: SMI1/KNR4 family protein [Woeseiaceae bacterium]